MIIQTKTSNMIIITFQFRVHASNLNCMYTVVWINYRH